ncbi:MAG: endonuclease/exonuclease/phosphatase family protein [Anaerolineae bacterium]|nr:endonuclease/exonuclease/phosphatase family protein [Anaerolineae bacterium]
MTASLPERPASRIMSRILAALCLLYGVTASLHLLLRLLVGEQFLPVTLLDQYLPAFWLLALPVMVICIGLRRWRSLALQLPPLILLISSYGVLFVPRPAIPARDDGLTLLTFNVSKDNRDFEGIARTVRAVGADVVALQEITPAAALYLEAALADEYPYQALHPADSYPGQGILSQYPLQDDDYWQIELGHQRVTLNIDDRQVALYSVHPVHPFLPERGFFNTEPRAREINDILLRVEGETIPAIVAGDFNMSDQTDDYFKITNALRDAFRARGSGFGFTFPSWIPIARLDYVFTSDAIAAIDAHVWSSNGGSDHFPLVVSLAFGR